MKSTGRKTVKVDRTSAPLRKTSKSAKARSKTSDTAEAKIETMAETTTGVGREGNEDALSSVATRRVPTHEEIAQRSYEIFLARGGQQGFGSPEQDWLQAERELRA